MRLVALDEIVGLERYEQGRSEYRRRIIEMKRDRRVAVGDRLTFVFENHETMLFQIQEMLRAEQIVDLDRVREEIEVYNALIPRPGELSSTMFIEIVEAGQIRPRLLELSGIEDAVSIRVGARPPVRGEFEAGRSKEDKLSAVQYVRFAFDPGAREAFVGSREAVWLVVDHRNYSHRAPIEGRVRRSLAHDLEDA